MEIIGYIASVFIGITLGLIGGGGSILTVPVLVYLFNISPVSATAYSLFIVGTTSIIGAITYMKRKEISYLTAVIFSIPAFVAVYLTRLFVIPAIPDVIFSVGSIEITKNILIMVLFAVMMLFASVSMIRKNETKQTEGEISYKYSLIALEGLVVGFFTGLVGAGGGFLIIPALVLLANLPMKMAVGTSLLIISVKSIIGFLGDMGTDMVINWSFLGFVGLAAILGIIIGSLFARKIDGKKLKPAFGWFVLTMGVYILGQEIIKVL